MGNTRTQRASQQASTDQAAAASQGTLEVASAAATSHSLGQISILPSAAPKAESAQRETQEAALSESFEAESGVERGIESSRGGGSPLPQAARAFMEPRFGASFANVRVHSDQAADDLSRSIGARAFATGSDIFFGRGEFEPNTSGGRELLAHELTHVVQQGGAASEAPEAPVARAIRSAPGQSLQRKGGAVSWIKKKLGAGGRAPIGLPAVDAPAQAPWQAATVPARQGGSSSSSHRNAAPNVQAPLVLSGYDGIPSQQPAAIPSGYDGIDTRQPSIPSGYDGIPSQQQASLPSAQGGASGYGQAIAVPNASGYGQAIAVPNASGSGQGLVPTGYDGIGARQPAAIPLGYDGISSQQQAASQGGASGYGQKIFLPQAAESEVPDAGGQASFSDLPAEVADTALRPEDIFHDYNGMFKMFLFEQKLDDRFTDRARGVGIETWADFHQQTEEAEARGEQGPRTAMAEWGGAPSAAKDAAEVQARGGVQIKGMDDEERRSYELQNAGKDPGGDMVFHWAKTGETFVTKEMTTLFGRNAGRAIFVMTGDGKVYVADHAGEYAAGLKDQEGDPKMWEDQWIFHHSSFLAGKPVAAAGEIEIDGAGHLIGISDASGHYRPESQHTIQILKNFVADGIDISKVYVSLEKLLNKRPIPATTLIEFQGDIEAIEAAYYRNEVPDWQPEQAEADEAEAEGSESDGEQNSLAPDLDRAAEEYLGGDAKLKELGLEEDSYKALGMPMGGGNTKDVSSADRLRLLRGEVTFDALKSEMGL